MEEKKVETQLKAILDVHTIDAEFRDWALDYLKETNERENNGLQDIYNSLENSLATTRKKMQRLTNALLEEIIDEQEFREQKSILQQDIKKLDYELKKVDCFQDKWMDTLVEAIDFITCAKDIFDSGSFEQKKSILLGMSSNVLLSNGLISLEPTKWLIPISNDKGRLKNDFQSIRTNKDLDTNEKKIALESVRSKWLDRLDSNQEKRLQRPL